MKFSLIFIGGLMILAGVIIPSIPIIGEIICETLCLVSILIGIVVAILGIIW